ncbi:hypothetical protein VNO78_28107 [Psophocarpus tetragonolobus]|uniref:IPO4/5-like TPR repeats domain-containing protein n=1 Tax=Psophocarpus tetragonolobus TaxID=3891 RepID=A0AAN9S1H6_PSOTE
MELQSKAFQVLSSNDNSEMETVLSHLYSPQHQQLRSQAIAFMEWCKNQHPDLILIKLFFLLRRASLPETRANAARAILLIKPGEMLPKLKPIAQAHLKAHFLTYLKEESSMYVLRHASVVLAETLSITYKTHQYWTEILDLLLSFMASNDDKSREVASLVFANLPNDCRFLISNALRDKRAVLPLHASFLSCLASSNLDLQVAAFAAVVSLARLFSEPSLFHDILRALMVGLFALLHAYQATYFPTAFRQLINLVSHQPLLLNPYINDMVLDVLQIAESETLNAQTHSLAFQFVIAMTAVKDYQLVFLHLPYPTVRRLFFVPMNMLQCFSDDGESTLHATNYLKKLSLALGAPKALPVAFELFSLHLDDADWKVRHAGITMLTAIAEDFSDEMVLMENFLVGVVTKVLKSMQDSHTQVRLATLKFMKTPTTFIQGVQILYHHRLVHAFCTALDNEQVVKVKGVNIGKLNTKQECGYCNGKIVAIASGKNYCRTICRIQCLWKDVFSAFRKQDKDNAQIRSIALTTLNIEAARGIRICAELGTPQLKPFVNRILPELIALMNNPNPSLSHNENAHDIAVSAIGRICEFHHECIDGSRMVPAWLNFLPLKNDLIEAKIMHEQLCLMVARLDKDLFGVSNQNLVEIIVILLEIIDEGDTLATAETIKQVNNLLRQLAWRIPRIVFDKLLNARQRELLWSLQERDLLNPSILELILISKFESAKEKRYVQKSSWTSFVCLMKNVLNLARDNQSPMLKKELQQLNKEMDDKSEYSDLKKGDNLKKLQEKKSLTESPVQCCDTRKQ